MSGENLDAALQPIAEALILIMVLIAVAAISFLVINKVAQRRRDRAHQKLSGSRRTKHTQVDLLGGAKTSSSRDAGAVSGSRVNASGAARSAIDIPPQDTRVPEAERGDKQVGS